MGRGMEKSGGKRRRERIQRERERETLSSLFPCVFVCLLFCAQFVEWKAPGGMRLFSLCASWECKRGKEKREKKRDFFP